MRLGLISGIHEDIIRLEAAISLLQAHNCEAIACLGDRASQLYLTQPLHRLT